ncbi:MAG: stage III sporulation AC/AD family protein [Clostridia bacterium]|nr:stage III sporulation AC/AD family protein [Clostridia bacterium]
MSVGVALGLALLGATLGGLLRELKSPYAPYVGILAGVALLLGVFARWEDIIPLWRMLEQTGVSEAASLVLKVLGVGYLTEIGGDVCRELGADTLAARLAFFGKIEIFLLCLPSLEELLATAIQMLG